MSDESSSSDDSLQDNPYQIVEFCGEENDQGQKMIEIINSKWMHRESKNTNKDDFASTQRRLKRLYKNRTDVESHISDSDSSGPQDILSKKRGAAMLKTSSSLKPQHGVAEDNDSLPVRSTSIHPRWKSSARCDTPPCISSTKAQMTDTADHSQKRPEEGINPTQTRGEKKTELQKRLEDLHHKGKADSQTKLLIDYLDAKFELITLKLQDEIQSAKRAQQYDLGKKVEDLKNSIAAPASDNKGDASARALLGVQLPIATLDEFEKFEQMLDPKSEVNAVNPEAALEKQALLSRLPKLRSSLEFKLESSSVSKLRSSSTCNLGPSLVSNIRSSLVSKLRSSPTCNRGPSLVSKLESGSVCRLGSSMVSKLRTNLIFNLGPSLVSRLGPN
ncbi:uncharacterized protein LOC107039345 [Diachasma alloeum]|uniref:uncharacterized protein LOC107039345 n=1 Tax=Diachasma alloeum TaxID=454923 RepID=UPI0007384041|nr:uncharacterized protein LOC107039345 [Diachasma alloeum]